MQPSPLSALQDVAASEAAFEPPLAPSSSSSATEGGDGGAGEQNPMRPPKRQKEDCADDRMRAEFVSNGGYITVQEALTPAEIHILKLAVERIDEQRRAAPRNRRREINGGQEEFFLDGFDGELGRALETVKASLRRRLDVRVRAALGAATGEDVVWESWSVMRTPRGTIGQVVHVDALDNKRIIVFVALNDDLEPTHVALHLIEDASDLSSQAAGAEEHARRRLGRRLEDEGFFMMAGDPAGGAVDKNTGLFKADMLRGAVARVFSPLMDLDAEDLLERCRNVLPGGRGLRGGEAFLMRSNVPHRGPPSERASERMQLFCMARLGGRSHSYDKEAQYTPWALADRVYGHQSEKQLAVMDKWAAFNPRGHYS